MFKRYSKTLGSALALSLMVGTAHAEVSADKAAALGKTLTPVGAEMAGNAAGTIPSWNGGLAKTDDFKNPFPEDKPKFVITGANYKEYAANLTDGQKAMFAKYPDTYKMPVYETAVLLRILSLFTMTAKPTPPKQSCWRMVMVWKITKRVFRSHCHRMVWKRSGTISSVTVAAA